MMHLSKFVARATLGAIVAVLATSAHAQLELKIMAPAGPGGGWDSAARSLQQVMTTTGVARSVQVTNVTGAGGTVGLAQFVNSAKGDGNQLMVNGITMVGAILTSQSPVNLDMVTPIARLTGDPLVIVVPANSSHKSVQDLATAVKADVAKVTWAGGSAGGADHILAALFVKAAGGDQSKVNYIAFSGGGEAIAAIVGGKVTAGISGYGEFESQIKAGKMRALAVWGDKRLAAMPDVPSMKELGYDATFYIWSGLFAPAATPQPVMTALRELVKRTVEDPEFKEAMAKVETPIAYLDAPQFKTFLDRDAAMLKVAVERIGKVPEN